MGNGYSISHVRCGIRPRRGSVSSYVALEERPFKRTDTSMRYIIESYQKIWACICQTRTTGTRLIQANLTYKSQAFFRRNSLGGRGGEGRGQFHCPTPLHDDQQKKFNCQISLIFAQNDDVMRLWILFTIHKVTAGKCQQNIRSNKIVVLSF